MHRALFPSLLHLLPLSMARNYPQIPPKSQSFLSGMNVSFRDWQGNGWVRPRQTSPVMDHRQRLSTCMFAANHPHRSA